MWWQAVDSGPVGLGDWAQHEPGGARPRLGYAFSAPVSTLAGRSRGRQPRSPAKVASRGPLTADPVSGILVQPTGRGHCRSCAPGLLCPRGPHRCSRVDSAGQSPTSLRRRTPIGSYSGDGGPLERRPKGQPPEWRRRKGCPCRLVEAGSRIPPRRGTESRMSPGHESTQLLNGGDGNHGRI